MDGKARLGQRLLLAIIVVTALIELSLTGFKLKAGRFGSQDVVRVLLTGWLLWRVWDGAGWARWLVAALFLVTGAGAVIAGLTVPAAQELPELMAFLIGLAAVCVAFGSGLASPWVGAYQSARRDSSDAGFPSVPGQPRQ